MEYDSSSKQLKISTTESFGRLLLDLLYLRSDDSRILKIQKFVGRSVLEAYIDLQIANLEKDKINQYERHNEETDIGLYIATRAEEYARNNPVELCFSSTYLDGIRVIAENEVDDLPKLLKEKEFASVVISLVDSSMINRYDETELQMIDDEIDQAKSAREVLGIIYQIKEEDQ